MVDIYASSVAKEVFEWIALIILTIELLWAMIFNGIVPEVADNMIKSIVPQTAVGGYILKFGGIALSTISLIMLYIYQIFWKPYKYLKCVDDDKLNAFINEQKNK